MGVKIRVLAGSFPRRDGIYRRGLRRLSTDGSGAPFCWEVAGREGILHNAGLADLLIIEIGNRPALPAKASFCIFHLLGMGRDARIGYAQELFAVQEAAAPPGLHIAYRVGLENLVDTGLLL